MIYDAKPWVKFYDPDVKLEIDLPNHTLKGLLEDSFSTHAHGIAFHYLETSITFEELSLESGRFATGLAQKGFGKGDILAINLPNIPQYLIALSGAVRAGCAVSGLSPLLMPDEIVYQLNDSGARVLLTMDALFEAKVLSVAHRLLNLELILVTGAFDYLSRHVQPPDPIPVSDKEVLDFKNFVEGFPDTPPPVSLSSEDPCYIQYTGGTTGPPKGALLTHKNMSANLLQYDHWMQCDHGGEVWLTGFPMFHQAGLFLATAGLITGTTQILIPDPRNVDHFVDEFKKYRPHAIANVPSLYFMLMENKEFVRQDFSNVRYCLSGAAPVPVDAINALEALVGKNKLIEVWGMTETSPLVTANPAKGLKKIGSVGIPFPNTDVRVVSLIDGEQEVPFGEEGELICSGPQVMKGYFNKPEETKNALREHDGRIWMHTGDVGKMDEDGYVYVVDRAKDMIIVGGYKVFSSEVEDKFYKHPAIGMCALIGIANPQRPDSEIVKLLVQKSDAYKDKRDSEIVAELTAFAKKNLSPYKVPKLFEFIDAIPLTSIGKVDKKALRVLGKR